MPSLGILCARNQDSPTRSRQLARSLPSSPNHTTHAACDSPSLGRHTHPPPTHLSRADFARGNPCFARWLQNRISFILIKALVTRRSIAHFVTQSPHHHSATRSSLTQPSPNHSVTIHTQNSLELRDAAVELRLIRRQTKTMAEIELNRIIWLQLMQRVSGWVPGDNAS